MKFVLFLLLQTLLFGPISCHSFELAQTDKLAFAGAKGFGKYTQGGHGGEIYVVTTLEDNESAGSLRHALKQKHPRIIQFAVSGVIKLSKPLKINNSHVTIEGQSSPRGVAIVGAPFVVSADEVIIQHMRFRLGTYGYAEDALTVRNTKNVIVDHCSISWGTDETASLYNNENFTLQYSIISNSLNKSIHPKGEHGYGGIWGGQNASFINNLIANHKSRTPRLNGHRLKSPYPIDKEYVELVNNVIYNWGQNSVYGSENGRFSLVNNYYLPGPNTTAERFLDLWFSDRLTSAQAYISGNDYYGKSWLDDNLLGVIVRDNKKKKIKPSAVPSLFTESIFNSASQRFAHVNETNQSAKSIIDALITTRDIGAFKTAQGNFHDSVDKEVLMQLVDTLAGKKVTSGIIDHENEQIESLQRYQAEFSN